MVPPKGRILCAVGDSCGGDGSGDGGGADTCRGLSSVFEEFGYEVVRARSVEEVLGLALAETLVLCVVDTAFHNGSGLALCSELRLLNRRAPVILYSNLHDEAEQQAGIAAGALAYVLQPNFDHLLLAVLHALPREHHGDVVARREAED